MTLSTQVDKGRHVYHDAVYTSWQGAARLSRRYLHKLARGGTSIMTLSTQVGKGRHVFQDVVYTSWQGAARLS